MDPKALIETYVADVAGRLPSRLRGDVGLELRTLLEEELSGRAEAAGERADEAMAMAMLRGFGAPAEVAERYQPEGITIIPPGGSKVFTWMALGGVALQWAFSLPAHFAAAGSVGHGLERIGGWWLTMGLGAFWWPGFMVTFAIIAAWLRARRPKVAAWTPAKVIDRDLVNRSGMIATLAFWGLGAAFWIALPWLISFAPPHLARIFVYDPGFVAQRALWLLPIWAAHFALYGYVAWRGRWTHQTRQLNTFLGLAVAALLVWWIAAGPIFTAPVTDQTGKAFLIPIIVLCVAFEAWRWWRDPRPNPAALAPAP